MRLIDADALLEKLSDKNATLLSALIDEQRTAAFYAYCKVVNAIEEMPTIDAVPVKHGKWEKAGVLLEDKNNRYLFEEVDGYRCSQCGQQTLRPFYFCPRCGAKMDEVSE